MPSARALDSASGLYADSITGKRTISIGIRSAAILSDSLDRELDASLTPAGRLLVPDAPDLPAPVASLFGSATPLQVLTERLARARGTNPDPIRRDDPAYLAAADAAEH